jgi:hypothetical protein
MRGDLSDREGRGDRSVEGFALCCLAQPGSRKRDDHLARIYCPLFDDSGMAIKVQDEPDLLRAGCRTDITDRHRSERSGGPSDMVVFRPLYRQCPRFVGGPSPGYGTHLIKERDTEESTGHKEREGLE